MRGRKIGIILQARMGSSRLPGKVLKPLAGKPMLQRIVERLQACRKADELILATSDRAQDQPIANLANDLGVSMFRGSESDVLDRYYQCALTYQLDDIIRATGDNPFVDPDSCDQLTDFYCGRQLDYAIISNSSTDGYPLGVGVEIFSFDALQKSWQDGHEPHHREHVDEYILEHPDIFRQAKMSASSDKFAPEISLTVDTPEDFMFAEKLYNDYFRQFPESRILPVVWAIKQIKKGNNRKEWIL